MSGSNNPKDSSAGADASQARLRPADAGAGSAGGTAAAADGELTAAAESGAKGSDPGFASDAASFCGTYEHGLDSKGRLIMPADFREQLGPHFQIFRSMDRCLYVASSGEWDRIRRVMNAIPDISNPAVRRVKRFLFGNSYACDADRQGRFLIPEKLRNYAGLADSVTIVGVGSRIELWNTDVWNANDGRDDYSADEAAAMEQDMANLGISF